jgi:SAM-dependent methyltransferase
VRQPRGDVQQEPLLLVRRQQHRVSRPWVQIRDHARNAVFHADVARVTHLASGTRPGQDSPVEPVNPARRPRLAAAVVRADVAHGCAELVADPDRPSAWTLLIDGTSQSHVDLADPTHLEFEYVRRTGHLLDVLAPPPPAPLRVLHLGGGAWTLPRYVAATRPGSVQRVVELDGALVDLVGQRLPADGLGLDVRIADARAGLAEVPIGSCDVVLLDVYAGARIPAHLTTVEFLRDVARVLRPGGCYAANLADGAGARTVAPRRTPLDFARAQAGTAGAVFAEVAVVASPDVLHGRRFGNVVLVAGTDLPVAQLARRVAADPFPARVEPGAAFADGAEVVTDADAVPSPRPPRGLFGQ